MQAYKCDRCGEYYRKFNETHIEVDGVSRQGIGTNNVYANDDHYNPLHLCESCIKEFQRWWVSPGPRVGPQVDLTVTTDPGHVVKG